MSGSADAPAASKAADVSSAGFASGGRRRCACGTMCFVALERRRARDTSLPDWCEIQDSDRLRTLETFGSKFPGGLLPADLRAAVAACSHSGGGGGRYSPAGFCCCCFGSPPPFPSLTSSRVRLLGASFSFFWCRANARVVHRRCFDFYVRRERAAALAASATAADAAAGAGAAAAPAGGEEEGDDDLRRFVEAHLGGDVGVDRAAVSKRASRRKALQKKSKVKSPELFFF